MIFDMHIHWVQGKFVKCLKFTFELNETHIMKKVFFSLSMLI